MKGLCDDFDPMQEWDNATDAIAYCFDQDDPALALRTLVSANIEMGEGGFAIELIELWQENTEVLPRPKDSLRAAAERLTKAEEISIPPPATPGAVTLRYTPNADIFDVTFRRSADGLFIVVDSRWAYPNYTDTSAVMAVISATASAPKIADFMLREIMSFAAERAPKTPFMAVPLIAYIPEEDYVESSVFENLRDNPEVKVVLASDPLPMLVHVNKDGAFPTAISNTQTP